MANSNQNKFNVLSTKWNITFGTILCLLSLLMLIPMLLVVIVSFSPESSIAERGFTFFPTKLVVDGYKYLGKMGSQVLDSYIVTIAHTLLGTLISLAVMSMYAYVLAQKTFPARTFMTWILCFTMLFGGGLVPSYIMNTRYYGLYDSFWIYIFPSLASAYNVIMLRTFLNTTVPDSLFEAGKIDGAGHFRIFLVIVLPLFKAGLATIALFSLVGRWNDWFTAHMYIANPKLVPIQTLLQRIQNNIDFLKQNSQVAGTPDGIQMMKDLPTQNLRMACTIIVVVPILMAYPFFQRYFVTGLTVGSVKG